MAATFTFTPDAEGREVIGRDREMTGVLTVAGTYTTNGDVVGADPAAQARIFGLSRFDDIEFLDAVTSNGFLPRYDVANRKILFHGSAAVAAAVFPQAGSGVSVAGTVRVRVRGK